MRSLLGRSEKWTWTPLLYALSAALCLCASGGALAADGVSVATVVVGKDSPSEAAAVRVGQIVRTGYQRNPRYSVLDLARFLDDADEAPAKQRLKAAEEALERGMSAYDAFDLEAALESLAEAVIAYEQALTALEDIEPVIDAYKFQGATYALTGDEKNAVVAFKRAFALDPAVSLDGGAFPDTVITLFEEARKEAEKTPTGAMTVYATPAAAAVWVDGRFRGASPIVIESLPQGRHYVRVERDGYLPYAAAVDVGRASEETVQATLRPTKKLSTFDDLAARMAGGSEPGARQLAETLKVDQLFWATVEAAGDNVTVNAFLTDGVGGQTLKKAQKAFVLSSPRFRTDLELWVAQTFRKGDVGTRVDPNKPKADPGGSLLPDAPVEPPTPANIVVGYVLLGGSAATALIWAGASAYWLYAWDVYRNQGKWFSNGEGIQNQTIPEVDQLRGALLISSIAGDIALVATGALIAGGVTLLIMGMNERASIEDLLSDNGLPGAAEGRMASLSEEAE